VLRRFALRGSARTVEGFLEEAGRCLRDAGLLETTIRILETSAATEL
jgi:hypothetical protein